MHGESTKGNMSAEGRGGVSFSMYFWKPIFSDIHLSATINFRKIKIHKKSTNCSTTRVRNCQHYKFMQFHGPGREVK